MYTLTIISFLTTLIGIGSLIHYVFWFREEPLAELIVSGGYVVYLALFVFGFPFVLSFLLSGRGHSLMFMIKAFIPYLFFMNMLIAWFGSYSYSRIWDLSWGNRPSNEAADISKEQQEFMTTKFKEISVKVLLAILVINLGVFFIPLEGQLIIMSIFMTAAAFQMVFSLLFCLYKIFYKIGFVCKSCKLKNSKAEEKIPEMDFV